MLQTEYSLSLSLACFYPKYININCQIEKRDNSRDCKNNDIDNNNIKRKKKTGSYNKWS